MVDHSVLRDLAVGVGASDELDRVADLLAAALPLHDAVTQLWWITRTGTQPWVVRTALGLA